jgi:hypothetical protein
MFIKATSFSAQELDIFRDLQRRSFQILRTIGSELVGGETEKEVAEELVRRYRAAGANAFFHLPVVLFGERTALPGNWSIGKFFPRRNPLQANDSVILDAAPFFDGYLVDTSMSFCFGSDPEHATMMQHLSQYRDSIPRAVNAGARFSKIADDVALNMEQAGFEAVHTKHPGEVLGHRTIRTPNLPFRLKTQGFDALSLSWFKAKDTLAGLRLGRQSPLWNQSKASDHRAHDGLWLVEPHAGCGKVGAKWEEILVIENGQARWLESQPPHVTQWQNIKSGKSYRPAAL